MSLHWVLICNGVITALGLALVYCGAYEKIKIIHLLFNQPEG